MDSSNEGNAVELEDPCGKDEESAIRFEVCIPYSFSALS